MSTRCRQSGDPPPKGPCGKPLVSRPTRKFFVNLKMKERGNKKDKHPRLLEKEHRGKRWLTNDEIQIERYLQYTGAGIDTERVAFA